MRKIFIIIIIVLIVLGGVGYLIYQSQQNPKQLEKACVASGGTVTTASCCQLTSDFPNSCAIGACGCAPDHSKQVKTCDCGDKCWNGTKCTKLNSIEFCGTSTNGQCSSDADCITGGCSGQVCQSKSEEPVITTCEYADCYNPQPYGLTCGCKASKCQWK